MLVNETDVKEHGNEHLPGFETRTVQDDIVLGTERFEFALMCCTVLC
jgi:hypothetical protein